VEVNHQQYHQAYDTPFGSGPLADIVGHAGDTELANQILKGNIPPLPSTLLAETIRILNTLSEPCPGLSPTPAVISEEEFINAYKVTPESTSSSPSGRHVGHYKAVLDNPTLVSLHTTMSSIPFQTGFFPEHWKRVVDIMLQKDTGNSCCHRLRIIALFESDLNQAKRILIGRRLSHLLEDNTMLPEMQQGSRPGKQCLRAVLKKVLSHDIIRMTKHTAALIENDAVGCYDHLVNNLVLMLLAKLGLPTTVIACLGTLWDSAIHLIKIVYGISDITYSSSDAWPLYGPDQGSTCGPLFWLLCYWVIVTSLDPSISATIFCSAICDLIVEITGVSFVDDTSLGVTSTYINNPELTIEENMLAEMALVVTNLTKLAQHWERLLFSTGGAINMKKSHWYLMTWLWKKGVPTVAPISKRPATLTLTTGYSSSPEVVPRIEPTASFRTLGVYLSPSGSQKPQIQILCNYVQDYYSSVSVSTLTPSEALWSYILYLHPKLTYPLPCSSLTPAQCRFIEAPI